MLFFLHHFMRELSEVIKEKKVAKTKILKQYNFPKNSRAVILNLISDENLKNFVTSACEEIGVSVIESLENFDKNLLIGADAVVSEKIEKNSEFEEIFEQAVTPIFPSASHYDFEEFNPMKFEGNAFLFHENKPFQIFEKICRMLENLNYVGDRRMLIKNLLEFSPNQK